MFALDATTTTPPDLWAIAGRVSVVFALLTCAIGVFIWRALLKAVFVAAMREAKGDFKAFCEELWSERMKKNDEAALKLSELEDKITFVEEAVHQQGKALLNEFTSAIQRQTTSIEAIADASTEALGEIKSAVADLRKETAATRESVAEINGFLSARDHTPAAKRGRR